MNRILKSCVLAVLLLPGIALAQAKIAVLNPELSIINTDEAQKKLQELRNEASVAANLKELETMQKEFKAATEQFQKDRGIMGEQEQQAKIRQFQEKQQDMEYLARKLQTAEQEKLQEIVNEMRPKFEQAVKEIIQAEGIDLLLDRKAALHVQSAYSITSKVTDKINQIK